MTAAWVFAVTVVAGAVPVLLSVLLGRSRRVLRSVPVRAHGRVLMLPEADLGDLELCDFFDCPREERRTAHAVSLDGSIRRCWNCGHMTTPGGAR